MNNSDDIFLRFQSFVKETMEPEKLKPPVYVMSHKEYLSLKKLYENLQQRSSTKDCEQRKKEQ